MGPTPPDGGPAHRRQEGLEQGRAASERGSRRGPSWEAEVEKQSPELGREEMGI